MDPTTATVLVQLALLALSCIAAVFSAFYARRAASFDVTRDFDQLAHTVAKLATVTRSQKMAAVRAAALVPSEGEAPAQQPVGPQPIPKAQLRALWRAKGGHA